MLGLRKSQTEATPEVALTVPFPTFVRLALLIIATIILLAALHRAAHAVLLIFIAFFLTLALNAPVYWLSEQLPGKRRGSRSLATTLSFLLIIVLLGAFLASIVPPLVRQTDNLVKAAPQLVQDLRGQNSEVGRVIRRYHLEKQVNTFSTQLGARLQNAGGAAFSTVQRIGSSFFSLVTILVLTFMMLVEGPRWLAFRTRHQYRTSIMVWPIVWLRDMYRVIKGFVNGQVTTGRAGLGLDRAGRCCSCMSAIRRHLVVVIFVCGLDSSARPHHWRGDRNATVALFHSTSAAVIILIYYLALSTDRELT
jgi:predicted PurR-regulated permease PerM